MADIPKIPGCETVLLLGPVSSGKTWLAKQWLATAPIVSERSVTLDTAAQFMDAEYFHSWGNPKEVAERLKENPYYYRCVYHPAGDALFSEFQWLTYAIWAVDNPRFFIIEECHEFASINVTHPQMKMMLRYSRHRDRLGLICTSQRAAEISTSLTDACRMAIIFKTDQTQNMEAICRRFAPIKIEDIESLRPCIYNDVKKICYQHPQVIVWMRGQGFKVYNLGDKIATSEEIGEWQEQAQVIEDEDSAVAQPIATEAPSLERPSGSPELKSPERT